jgi:hypothetical protein
MSVGAWVKPAVRALRSALRAVRGIPDPPRWETVWPLPLAVRRAPPKRVVDVRVDETPNPLARKLLTPEIIPGPGGAYDARSVAPPAVAAALLGVPGVVGVFLSRHFVTVTRDVSASWDAVEPAALAALAEALS